MAAMTPRHIVMFEQKFTKSDGCWLWEANKLPSGYGMFRVQNTMQKAHRIAYQTYIGSFDRSLHVLHTCDVRNCVNPAHLFLGTNADNVKDKMSKDRQQRLAGELNGRAILTETSVKLMRKQWASGLFTQGQIAAQHGCKLGTVSGIVNRTAWKTVL